jgi:hypothetical protein
MVKSTKLIHEVHLSQPVKCQVALTFAFLSMLHLIAYSKYSYQEWTIPKQLLRGMLSWLVEEDSKAFKNYMNID